MSKRKKNFARGSESRSASDGREKKRVESNIVFDELAACETN